MHTFKGPFRFLSNFYPSRIQIEGNTTRYLTAQEFFGSRTITFATVENGYQGGKSADPDEQDRILRAPSPGQAKRLGRRVRMRPDFEQKKFALMEDLVDAKFSQNVDLRAALLGTGNRPLVEGAPWGDRIWGVCNGVGENHLGKTLMRVRDRLRNESLASSPDNPKR